VRACLLRSALANGMGAIVFLFGVYIVLRVSGLTQLALTVVGGTGLVGLAVGLAFRDITENFLASIFLSMQRPFDTGDLIEVAEVTGYVQQLNVRTTILMTLEGNLVQIPNSKVYKSNIRNFTTNPSRREDFTITIGYQDSINDAQDIASKVLREHAAILKDPEPSVLVDSLGSDYVNLRVYFWINGRDYSWLKVRSSVIRLVKVAFQKNSITMPDEARKLVFPRGVSVTVLHGKSDESPILTKTKPTRSEPKLDEIDAVSTRAEGGLNSEAAVIQEQARKVQPLKEKENLLETPAAPALPAHIPEAVLR
jgi:small conductance mechanosensitive channel